MSLLEASNKSQLEWIAGLQIPPKAPHQLNASNLRKTAIIGTIGPKTNSPEMINKLRPKD
ncbi:hypothetical protein PSHT_16507 [Puccinia striiformis]|uniref:Pyruvate kinase n=1 Tax=Puccinia striiformis TaxID=27350 RepID=A0A2S4U9I9_9BASI|nr:hypothetical protein PSHT_16507 [Puccinia striiformis]